MKRKNTNFGEGTGSKSTGKTHARKPRKMDRLTQRSGVDLYAFLKARCRSEYKFCEGRAWKFDFAIPEYGIAIEVEGGIFNKGRHTRSLGYLADMEKYNTATALGWAVYRFAPWQFDLMIEMLGEKMGWVKA